MGCITGATEKRHVHKPNNDSNRQLKPDIAESINLENKQ